MFSNLIAGTFHCFLFHLTADSHCCLVLYFLLPSDTGHCLKQDVLVKGPMDRFIENYMFTSNG